MASRQLLDERGEVVGSFAGLGSAFGQVVAVLGPQSSGKSTFCNAAFGLDLPTLDATAGGRKRVTVGVWGAVAAKPAEGVVVLDVEGADGRARGEGKLAFETRVALLALAVADVLVVNIWCHDLGRRHGTSRNLFEVILSAWARQPRPYARSLTLTILLRDMEPDTPLQDAARLLRGDIHAMWTRLTPHTPAAGYALDACRVNLNVVGLPHYRFAKDAWHDQVDRLAATLTSPSLRTINHDLVAPLHVLDHRFAAVWADLNRPDAPTALMDLPSHPALVAAARARLAAQQAFRLVETDLAALSASVAQSWEKPIDDFGHRAAAIVDKALAHFTESSQAAAASEDTDTVDAIDRQRRSLLRKLREKMAPMRNAHLVCCEDRVNEDFDSGFALLIAGTRDFDKRARGLRTKAAARFRGYLDKCKWPSPLDEESPPGGLSDLDRYLGGLDEQIQQRAEISDALLPEDGENLMVDAMCERPPWWKPLLIQVANLALNIGANWLLVKLLGGGRDDPRRKQRGLERKQPPVPTF